MPLTATSQLRCKLFTCECMERVEDGSDKLLCSLLLHSILFLLLGHI